MLGFLGTLVALTALVHTWIWWRLVRGPGWGGLVSTWGGRAIVVLAVSVPLAMVLSRVLPRAAAAPLAWLAFSWLGVLFYLILSLAVMEIPARAAGLLVSPERRQLISQVVALGAMASSVGFGLLGLYNVARGPVVKRLDVPLARLDPKLDGLKVAQITDIHIDSTTGREFMAAIVAELQKLEPDIIVITGDLVDGSVAELAEHVAPLAELRAPHGVYFVTGNHEYYSGATEWIAYLGQIGMRVLTNALHRIEHKGAALQIAGVPDWTSGRFEQGHSHDLPTALAGRDEAVALILLAHQPKSVLEASKLGVDLQLSGHTHGGQLKPLEYIVALDQPAVEGLHRFGDTTLYVSPGTGTWGPAARVGTRSEITLLTLRSVS